MKRSLFLILALLVGGSVHAQRVTVGVKGSNKIQINLSKYRAGRDKASQLFVKVLKADLNRSGYFEVSTKGGAIYLQGSCGATKTSIMAECLVVRADNRVRLLGKRYQDNDVRDLAHKVADEILMAVTGKPGMAQAKIALVSNRTKRKELYMCDIDGARMRQLTKDRGIVVGPRWVPNGKQITYTSYRRGYPNVYLITPASGERKCISSYRGLNASGRISPDGVHMAVILSKDGNPELYVKNLKSGQLRRMTKTKGTEGSPCWSPDGSKIAYVSDSSGSPQIYVTSIRGGKAMRLTRSGAENLSPDWGENGYIAFTTRSGGKYRIAIANPSAGTMRTLETDWADYEDPTWAPDGRHIICSRTSGYRSAIYLLDTDKDSPVALVSESADWYSPACSP